MNSAFLIGLIDKLLLAAFLMVSKIHKFYIYVLIEHLPYSETFAEKCEYVM